MKDGAEAAFREFLIQARAGPGAQQASPTIAHDDVTAEAAGARASLAETRGAMA